MEPHNVVALSSRGDTKRMLHDAGAQNMFVCFFFSGVFFGGFFCAFLWSFTCFLYKFVFF